jgi:hypothetical protein
MALLEPAACLSAADGWTGSQTEEHTALLGLLSIETVIGFSTCNVFCWWCTSRGQDLGHLRIYRLQITKWQDTSQDLTAA